MQNTPAIVNEGHIKLNQLSLRNFNFPSNPKTFPDETKNYPCGPIFGKLNELACMFILGIKLKKLDCEKI